MNKKEQKIEALFSAIGEIDDELLYEAQTYRRVRKTSFNYGMLAACLALVFVIAIALPLINALNGLNGEASPETTVSLDKVMLDCRGGNHLKHSSFEELSYLGEARLVWQYVDSGEIYSMTLSSYQLSKIEKRMGKGTLAGEQSPQISCKLWVLDGRGNVKTPYLENSAGNIGCEIFDYDAELIPDESMVECILDIMN